MKYTINNFSYFDKVISIDRNGNEVQLTSATNETDNSFVDIYGIKNGVKSARKFVREQPHITSFTLNEKSIKFYTNGTMDFSSVYGTAVYSNGTSFQVNSGKLVFDTSKVDITKEGEYTATASCVIDNKTYSDTITVTVETKKLVLKKITTSKTSIEGTVGTKVDVSSITATAYYDDGSTKAVSNADLVFGTSAADAAVKAGTYSVKASYTENNVTVSASISAVMKAQSKSVLKSISLSKSSMAIPNGGTASDFTKDITAAASYSDGTEKTIQNASLVFDYSSIKNTTTGTYPVSVSYTESGVSASAELSCFVSRETKIPVSIYYCDSDGKKIESGIFNMKNGSNFGEPYLNAMLTYNDGSTLLLKGDEDDGNWYSTYWVESPTLTDTTKAGTYAGKITNASNSGWPYYTYFDVFVSCDISIVVSDPYVTSISKIQYNGDELAYSVKIHKGTDFDFTKISAVVKYNDGSTKTVSQPDLVLDKSNYDNTKVIAVGTYNYGENIPVSYTENGITVTNSFGIYIIPNIAGISIDQKTVSALKGSTSLNTSSLTATATYEGSLVDEEIATKQLESSALSYSTSAVDFTKAGSYTATVSYTENSITVSDQFTVVIIDASVAQYYSDDAFPQESDAASTYTLNSYYVN